MHKPNDLYIRLSIVTFFIITKNWDTKETDQKIFRQLYKNVVWTYKMLRQSLCMNMT